jgi:hypothetical protein
MLSQETIKMKYSWPVALLFICATLAAVPAQTAKERPKSSPNSSAARSQPDLDAELKEAQAAADRFIRRMRETRDLTPLVAEMFTSDFKQLIENDDSWSGLVGVGFSLTEHLNADERQRCFVAAFTWRYLVRLHIAGRMPLAEAEKAKTEDLLPPEIIEYFRQTGAVTEVVVTTEQAHQHLARLVGAAEVMRKVSAKNPPEETAQFKRNLANFEAHLQQYKEEQPAVWALDTADRFGHPAGTLMARFIIPFHVGLVMVKEKGEYKVWAAMTDIPSD